MFFRNTIRFYNSDQYDQFYISFELHIQAVISRQVSNTTAIACVNFLISNFIDGRNIFIIQSYCKKRHPSIFAKKFP